MPGDMNLPGPFGGLNPQINSIGARANQIFSDPKFAGVQSQINSNMPAANTNINRFTQGNPQIAQMIQAITGGMMRPGGAAPSNGAAPPQSPSSPPNGDFWHPNDGVQRPDISNTPSTTSPTSPFSMPQAPQGANRWSNFIPPPRSPNYNIK